MNTPHKPNTRSKARRHDHKDDPKHGQKHGSKNGAQKDLAKSFQAKMEKCKTAEDLNAQVITPFIQSLVTVCDARGYVLNIYGDHCNLVISPEDHAEQVFKLIESYLDEADVG
jgi:hypothetical protein